MMTTTQERALRLAGVPWEFVTSRVPEDLQHGVAIHVGFDADVATDPLHSIELYFWSSVDGAEWREEGGCTWTGHNSPPRPGLPVPRSMARGRKANVPDADRLQGRVLRVVVTPARDMYLAAALEIV